jgi:hypothetical protein
MESEMDGEEEAGEGGDELELESESEMDGDSEGSTVDGDARTGTRHAGQRPSEAGPWIHFVSFSQRLRDERVLTAAMCSAQKTCAQQDVRTGETACSKLRGLRYKLGQWCSIRCSEGRRSNAPDAAVGFLLPRGFGIRLRAEWGTAGCWGREHGHRGGVDIRAEVEGVLDVLQV